MHINLKKKLFTIGHLQKIKVNVIFIVQTNKKYIKCMQYQNCNQFFIKFSSFFLQEVKMTVIVSHNKMNNSSKNLVYRTIHVS